MTAREDAAELEQQILADPEADEPRRRLGELLVSLGEPRGKLIQLQMREARQWRKGSTPPYEVHVETTRLIELCGPRLAGPIAFMVSAYEFRRGFVEHITLDAERFLDEAMHLYGLAPIRHLTLTGARSAIAKLTKSRHLERIRSLGLAGQHLGDDAIATLAHSPHLAGLRWLDLRDNDLTKKGLECLAGSHRLDGLRFVRLEGNPGGDPTPRPSLETWGQWTDPDVPPLGRELIARFGPRPWLTTPPAAWPADRDFDPDEAGP